jgi:hypothetical protein
MRTLIVLAFLGIAGWGIYMLVTRQGVEFPIVLTLIGLVMAGLCCNDDTYEYFSRPE